MHDDPGALVAAMGVHGLRAKIRTGGVTADAFPSARDVARFLSACARHDVMFKATAGLHHPLRGDFALTCAADAPRGTMFGFLNVFLAAAFMRRGHSLSVGALAEERARFALSFGSCSFREPIDDLLALHLQ